MEITGFFKDELSMQANEAGKIGRRQPKKSLNSKSEFNSAQIARITIDIIKKTRFPKEF